jgi:hypothetical protein
MDIHGVIDEIYSRAGLAVTPTARAAFAQYDARRPPGHFGSHDYDPSRWAVTPELVAEHFGDYLNIFPEIGQTAAKGA